MYDSNILKDSENAVDSEVSCDKDKIIKNEINKQYDANCAYNDTAYGNFNNQNGKEDLDDAERNYICHVSLKTDEDVAKTTITISQAVPHKDKLFDVPIDKGDFESKVANLDTSSTGVGPLNIEEATVNFKQENIYEKVKELIEQTPEFLNADRQITPDLYTCAVCNASFLELSDLDQHVSVHKVQRSTKVTKKHKKVKKRKDGKVKVKKIKKKVKIEEQEGTSEDKIYKCGLCSKTFSLSYYLKLHVRTHTGEKPYICTTCGQAFVTASKLNRHSRVHAGLKFECRICHKLFSRLEYLKRHFDKKHEAEKLDHEPYDYNNIVQYIDELEREANEKSKEKKLDDFFPDEEKCAETETANTNVCRKDSRRSGVFIHTATLSEREANDSKFDDDFPFPDVASDSDSSSPISKHQTPKTSPQEPSNTALESLWESGSDADVSMDCVKCKVCGKSVKTGYYMKIHQRIHTGERPYQCYICQKAFITSSKLQRHVMTHLAGATKSGRKRRNFQVMLDPDCDPDLLPLKVELEEDEPPKDTPDDADQMENGVKEPTETNMADCNKLNLMNSLKLQTRLDESGTDEPPPSDVQDLSTSGRKTGSKQQKRLYGCKFCHKTFVHLGTLHCHVRKHRGQNGNICKFCQAVFEDLEALKAHRLTHNGDRPYECTLCGTTYAKQSSLIIHRKKHMTKKTFQCDFCAKTFIAPCKLKRHMLIHRPGKHIVRYECPVCAHIFNTRYHMEMHLGTHEKEGLIHQQHREEVLAMAMHNARRIPVVETSYQESSMPPSNEPIKLCSCYICGNTFRLESALNEHLKFHSEYMKHANLPLDAKVFSGLAVNAIDFDMSLEKLKAMTNTEEKRYRCHFCDKAFKLHYYLKLHIRTHTNEKPHICQQCGKGFITGGKLKRHIQTHTGEKKFQCPTCLKYFSRPSYLRIHSKTHNNFLP